MGARIESHTPHKKETHKERRGRAPQTKKKIDKTHTQEQNTQQNKQNKTTTTTQPTTRNDTVAT